MTGKDLSILINCNYLPHHHWMTFSSWYSIYKNLPDAHVKVFCDKSIKSLDHELFTWISKLKIEFSYKKPLADIEIPCDAMAIRTWISPEIYDVKSEDVCTFCTYKNGCGNFVMDEWINSIDPPFSNAEEFKKEVMTINEIKILELWRKALPTYTAMG